MANQIDHIVEHFFRKKTLDEVSVYELERFIATHPYFAAGHFLMARKAQVTEPGNVHQKIATAALYYPNPLWLQWLLEQKEHGDEEIKISGEANNQPRNKIDETPVAEVSTAANESADTVVEDEDDLGIESRDFNSATKTEVVTDPAQYAYEEKVATAGRDEASSTSPEVEDVENKFESAPETLASEDHVTHIGAAEEEVAPEAVNEVSPTTSDSKNVESEFEPAPEIFASGDQVTDIDGADEHASNNKESFHFDDNNKPEVSVAQTAEENVPQFRTNTENESTDESEHGDDIPVSEGESNITDEESRAAIQKTLGSVSLIPTKAELEKNEFTFEPYHTIDYFASQGIKLQQSDLSKDKFGKQLKSFTDWLRSMKRLPQAPLETNIDEATQQSIQRIAEHSFEEKDIVTETMAEVWIKQGNKEKAIDTLHKLSLLNPSKSHYFAAKIEQLKVT